MTSHHLAQFNVARFLKPLDDPANKEFVDQLDAINGHGDDAPGFVWREKDESGNSTDVHPDGDPLVIINFSVWETRQQLWDFTFSGEHLAIMRRRRDWFEQHAQAYNVMWWVPAGTIPSVKDAMERLTHLRENGPSDFAFGFRDEFLAPAS